MINDFSQKIYAIMEGVEYYGELKHLAAYCKGKYEFKCDSQNYNNYLAQSTNAAAQFELIESELIKLIKEITGE